MLLRPSGEVTIDLAPSSVMFRQAHTNVPFLLNPVRSLWWALLCPMAAFEETASLTRPALRGFQIVVAATRELGIGQFGHLPWKLPSDLKFFKDVTSTTTSIRCRNAVIMGRHTWESLPSSVRPLPGRTNVVLSKSLKAEKKLGNGTIVANSLLEALAMLAAPPFASEVESVFVIGGGQLFRYVVLQLNGFLIVPDVFLALNNLLRRRTQC